MKSYVYGGDGTMNKRQELAKQTRQKLIQSAQKLFSQKDFQDVCIEDITQDCGVAKGTFYTYFKKKEDIISEIGFQHFEELQERILQSNQSILKKLDDYCLAFMELFEEYEIHICRQWIINNLNPHSDTVNYIQDQTKIEFDMTCIQAILKQGVDTHRLNVNTPIELLSYLLMSQLYSMMTIWCMSDQQFEPLEWVKSFNQLQLPQIFKDYLKEEKA